MNCMHTYPENPEISVPYNDAHNQPRLYLLLVQLLVWNFFLSQSGPVDLFCVLFDGAGLGLREEGVGILLGEGGTFHEVAERLWADRQRARRAPAVYLQWPLFHI